MVKPVDFHEFANVIRELGAFLAVINEQTHGIVKSEHELSLADTLPGR